MRHSNTRTTELQLLPSRWVTLAARELSIAATSTTARENKDGYHDMKKRKTEVARERERCGKCIESIMPLVTDPITQSMLVRVHNQIMSGTEKPMPPAMPTAGVDGESQ